MADDRLLDPIRRFWSAETVETAYEAIFTAYHSRLEKVTVIIGKGTEGDTANAQVVINSEDYLRWMDALETRMKQIENEADGVTATIEGTDHTNFGNRILTT